MKIGILTFHFSDNFGAVLQAYALRRWLVTQGHQAEFINYHPDYVEDGGKLLPPSSKENIKANLKIIYLHLANLQRKISGNNHQKVKFESFRKETLGVISKKLRTLTDLSSANFNYDIIITGSDQVWNPSTQKGLDPAYFLAFTTVGVRRISYAASFGKDLLPEAYHQEARSLLSGMDAISVRERSGVQIVATVAGREAACVPDPTLLHSEYSALVESSTDAHTGHVFCYALRTGEGVREVANLAAQRLGTEVISPYNVHRRWREIGTTVYPGPADWLRQVKQASFVVTNSFHGTVFSIIFRKPFVVVGLPGGKADLNARAKNLLASVGLMHRFVETENWMQAEALLTEQIDWDSVAEKQAVLRASGQNFLFKEIKNGAKIEQSPRV